MNALSAWMRCFRPRSMWSHSSARDDARDQVEGKDALGAGGVAVDVEGDAHLQQQALGGVLVAQQMAVGERLDGLQQQPRVRPRLRRRRRTSRRRSRRVSYAPNCMSTSSPSSGARL